jgi:hypothetical protein
VVTTLSLKFFTFMPHVNRLTEATIRNAIRRHKPYRLSDGMGLRLIVNPDRSKRCRVT